MRQIFPDRLMIAMARAVAVSALALVSAMPAVRADQPMADDELAGDGCSESSGLGLPGEISFRGIPEDINGFRTVIPEPERTQPLRIAIYQGAGSPLGGINNVGGRLLQIPGSTIERLSPERVKSDDLSGYDLIVFSGGTSMTQARTIGEEGKQNIRKYVANGGHYLGVCAGAYLAIAGEEWSIGMVNARLVPGRRWRGSGFMDIEFSDDGRTRIADVDEPFKCRYRNGPTFGPLDRPDLPPYTVLAWFRSEVNNSRSVPGTMIDSPAIIEARYGEGRVLLVSPHPENTPGLDHLLSRAVLSMVLRRDELP
jgi:hypothetical protein